MSFFDDLIDVGSNALGWLGGKSIGSQLARTAITGYALSKLYRALNKDEADPKNNQGTRQQLQANPSNSIPVVYGTAFTGGIITDAELTNSNGTMYFCLTICEKTGNTNLGAGAASQITFGEIYWNDMRLIFASDGKTVTSSVDREGNVCDSPNSKMQIWLFKNGSTNPVAPKNSTATMTENAYDVFPNWTSNHAMTNLAFAIVRLDYDPEADVTSLGDFKFEVINSMSLAGDCLYDYMTNTRYGASINSTNIYMT